MAAIEKIYISDYDNYLKFKEWCHKQPNLIDKYGKECPLSYYLYDCDSAESYHSLAFKGPYYADAYLIRHCPFDFVQEELMLNYGYHSQKCIDDAYKTVIDRKNGIESPFYSWLTEDDFTIVNGVVTMLNTEKSAYELIRDGELYNSPTVEYEVGRHFKCIKYPGVRYNKPIKECWFVSVDIPNTFMWYHSNNDTWDFCDEFVISKWSSSTAFCSTIKALKRKLLKWKLPVGAIVTVCGYLICEEYKFKITK